MSRQTDLDRPRRSERTSGSSLADTETESVLTEEHAAGTNLDKIRDILFGAQVRDHERRFAKLEAQLLAEAAQLRNDLKERFASLEQYIRKEVDTVTGRLTAEEQDAGRRAPADGDSAAGAERAGASRFAHPAPESGNIPLR